MVPSAQIYYAHEFPGPVWRHASPNRNWVSLFGFGVPIVQVRIRERTPEDPPSKYWGWISTERPDRYEFVWPSEHQMEICFYAGTAENERLGKGRKVNLILEKVEA